MSPSESININSNWADLTNYIFTCSNSFPTVFNKLHKHSSGSSTCLVTKFTMQYNIIFGVRIFCLKSSPINLAQTKILH